MISRISSNFRDRVLNIYAQELIKELNAHTYPAAEHQGQILAGTTSQVIVEVVPTGAPYSPIVLIRQPEDWCPIPIAIIDFTAPNKIIVTRPSEYLEHMHKWSNVAAWGDAGFIIGEILAGALNKGVAQ